MLGWTNLAYYAAVVSYVEYITATSAYYEVKDFFGENANSKWATNLGIRFLLPFTTVIYAIMFILSLFMPSIFGNFFEWMWKFSVYGFYGLNLLTTFWDDLYRVWGGETVSGGSLLDLFGIDSPGVWEAFPEFRTMFFAKLDVLFIHVGLYLIYRSKSEDYLTYRMKFPNEEDCTEEKDENKEEEEIAEGDDVVDLFEL